MRPPVYVFDPTANDKLSSVRGVGRYLQILRENFSREFKFVSGIENPQLKIENCVFINPFFNFLQPPLLMRRIAKKQIAIVHDLIPLKYPEHFPAGLKGNINIFLNKLALKNYDLIITDSKASKNDIVDLLNLDNHKVKVIYPCIPSIFKEVVSSKQLVARKESHKNKSPNYSLLSTNYCLYVGDATWNKNLVNLAKAIKIINVACVFVGKVFTTSYYSHPWQKEFKQFLVEVKDDKRFIFPGFIPDKDLLKLYEQCKVNMLVSRDEGFGFSYLEAASLATPSVLSDIPVLHEISDNQGALFTDLNDPNNIASAIGELYFNHDLRSKLGFKAQQQAKKFTQKRFIKDVLSSFIQSC